ETICLKCLHKEPSRRYASAAELAADLERFREGQPIHARRVSTRERVWKWLRRRPMVASLMTLALLVGLTLGLVLWRTAARESVRREQARGEVQNLVRDAKRAFQSRDWTGAEALASSALTRIDAASGLGDLRDGAIAVRDAARSEREESADFEVFLRLRD